MVEVLNAVESEEGWQYASLAEHVCRPYARIK